MADEIKLTIGIPTSGMVRAGFAYSLAGLIGRISAGIQTLPDTGIELSVDVQESSVIHSNREMLVQRALQNGKTHLLFLDDDMTFDPQVIDILLGRRHHVVATNYLIKRIPPDFVAVSLGGRRIITEQKSTGLQEIAYSGFGVSLFDLDVFRKTPQPWFLPEWMPDIAGGMYTTEDNPCFRRMRDAGFKCFVDHDASKLVSHAGSFQWTWQQYKRPEKAEEK